VIETPLEGDLDVNGWDLGKALKLLLKGNAVIIEWLRSPVMYGVDEGFRDDFLALAMEVANPTLIARHYLHLGLRQRRTYFADHADVPQKKLFYALRPAATLRWLRMNPGEGVAPMHFPTLMRECDPPGELRPVVDDLLARKAVTHELGGGPAPSEIMAFIDAEFALASETVEIEPVVVSAAHRAMAEAFFRKMTLAFDPASGGR
jgi:predicted nucleotidyltransferase